MNENYKEPINDNFDDCTKDILRDFYESGDSDEDDCEICNLTLFHNRRYKMENQ